jgi:hypothetical protein
MQDSTRSQSRFVFYCTAPVLLVFIIVMALAPRPGDAMGWGVLIAVELLAILALLGLFDSQRFWWCWRAIGAIIFLTYVAYLISTIHDGRWFGNGRRSSATAINAAIGLIVFGLPGLWFAIFGRLTLYPDQELLDEEDTNLVPSENERQS